MDKTIWIISREIMLSYVMPNELDDFIQHDKCPVLLACLDMLRNRSQKGVLNRISHRFGNNLQICVIDVEYINVMEKKFRIKGTPSYVLLRHGKERDIFLGSADENDLKVFIEHCL